MAWQLIIKSVHGEHVVPLAGTTDDAQAALAAAQPSLGGKGVVQVAGRLALRAEDITSAQIIERHLLSENRRRERRY